MEEIIMERLGRGGMADVYLVSVQGSKKVMVLKKPRYDEDTKKRSAFVDALEKEAKILQELNHPYIPKVYKYTKEGLYMEYVQGVSLDQFLLRKKQSRDKTLRDWMLQLISILAYLHTKGLLYLDIKPQNIILDKTGKLHMVDFGTCTVAKDVIHRAITPRLYSLGSK